MKVIQVFTLVALIFITQAAQAETPDKFISGFPHVYEFDSSYNPDSYYWCGHAVLASALKQVGKTTDIKTLHNIFSKNSPGGYKANKICNGKYCAKVQDLMWATKNQYGLPYSQGSLDRTSLDLLTKVKDAVKWGRGVIIPSNYGYPNIGHFWLIVGYKENLSNVDHSILFMRDMAKPKQGKDWDKEVKAGSFVYHTNFNGKIPYLIIKD